uniref:BRO family protein n=1 Tax=uncultured Desulfovibrio sp. TaxID=167968 RepID=UPI0026064511
MVEDTISQSAPIVNENGLHYVEFEGQIYFSSEEIGRQLGYRQPLKSINVLWNRNQRELKGYATGIKLMSVDGCLRETRCFTEEGVYILSMLAQTPQAREFRAKLARLLREIRERRMTLAREAGYRQGREEGQMARQEAARLVWQLGPAQKRRLRAAVRYRGLGLGREALARLLRCHSREVSRLLKAARAL